MAGSSAKKEARELPAIWREKECMDEEERSLSATLLHEASLAWWPMIVLDEGWTVRRAAQIMRQSRAFIGDICYWINQWARPPEGTPPPGSSPPESAGRIRKRCFVGQCTYDPEPIPSHPG